MPIVIKKDITTVETGVLVNGVNCQAKMGSGVAKAYLDKWPEVKEEYMFFHPDDMVLGKFEPVMINKKLYVANCWTQEFYGYDAKQYANLGAILASVSQAALFAKKLGVDLFTPWVGCGLGGLHKEEVKNVLNEIARYTDVNIYICEIE